MLKIAIPGEQKTFEILLFDTVGQSKWQLSAADRREVLECIHAEFRTAVIKFQGEYRIRNGDGAVAYFPTERGGNLGVRAGKYFLGRRTNIINIVGQSHPNLTPKFRIILTRGEVHCAKDPGADLGKALDDVMKNEKTYGKENTFRILEAAYAELKSDYRCEFRKLRGKNVYELTRGSAPIKPSRKEVAAKEFDYYKFFANMTVTNLAARNNITSYLINRVRTSKPSYQKDPGGFVRRVFDTKEFVSVVLDSVYLFFTKTFRDAEFWITFWTPQRGNKISVAAYKYPPGERCATFDRGIVLDPNKSAAGYALLMNEMLLIPDVKKTNVPFEFFYAGQEKKKDIISMACFPVGGSLSGEGSADTKCGGVLCVCTNRPELFNPEDRYVYNSHISSYVLNLELACEMQKRGVK